MPEQGEEPCGNYQSESARSSRRPAGPAGAAGAAAKTTTTGPEVVSGSAHGKAAIANVTPVPLTLAGVVATTDGAAGEGRGRDLPRGGRADRRLTTPSGGFLRRFRKVFVALSRHFRAGPAGKPAGPARGRCLAGVHLSQMHALTERSTRLTLGERPVPLGQEILLHILNFLLSQRVLCVLL